MDQRIEPPSLWPKSQGLSATTSRPSASRGGRNSRAWWCMKSTGHFSIWRGSTAVAPARDTSPRQPAASHTCDGIPPPPDRAQPFMQEHDQRLVAASRGDPPMFDAIAPPVPGDVMNCSPVPSCRASRVRLALAQPEALDLPVAVLGSSSMNSMLRGYLCGASFSLTKAFNRASMSSACTWPGLSTRGLGPGQALAVVHADHRGFQHVGVLHQRGLDLEGRGTGRSP